MLSALAADAQDTQPLKPASQQAQANQAGVSSDDIAGVVRSSKGPEAGVWVIAETDDFQTKFWKIVVTDDQGRFVMPALPKAKYKVWVRGYGLVDSDPVESVPGTEGLALKAKIAPNAQAAAQVYPPNYWYSMLKFPADFPGSGEPKSVQTFDTVEAGLVWQAQNQLEFTYQQKVCFACHQLGDKATRELPENFEKLGKFDSLEEAWARRIESGQLGQSMKHLMENAPAHRAFGMYADWTRRITAGEVPPVPPRPQGLERNVVVTGWLHGEGPEAWNHDIIASDKRNPTVNGNGFVYGAASGNGSLTIVDPVANTSQDVLIPTLASREAMTEHSYMGATDYEPSAYFEGKKVWVEPSHPHNVALDETGLVWITTRIRPDDKQPGFCKEGSDNPYTKYYPVEKSDRQVATYDPKSKKFTLIDTCFSTHHLQFADDKDDTLYFSGESRVVSWLNTKKFLETGDAEASQGWCPAYIDANGNGKFDRDSDKTIQGAPYGIMVNPVDGSIWYGAPGLPGKIVRMERGANPPATCRSEFYEPPFGDGTYSYSVKGLDFQRNGTVWVSLYSGHMASFDRSKCTVKSGPQANGQHCREGWSLHKLPGPSIATKNQESADFMYFNWVDQFNTFGLGADVPMTMGTNSDALHMLQPGTDKWLTFRVPYPMGFFSRGVDGRIDDPKAGWKGRGVWATSSDIPVWHQENGPDGPPFLVRFQLRASPLER